MTAPHWHRRASTYLLNQRKQLKKRASIMARLRAWAIVAMSVFGIIGVFIIMGQSLGTPRGGEGPVPAAAFAGFNASGSNTAVPLPTREVYAANGERTSLSNLRGKIVVLNVWATSCAPCVVEMPSLNRLQKQLGSEHFIVAPVALQPDVDEALKFYSDNGLDALPFFADPTLSVGFDIAAPGLPTTVVFGPDGREIARHAGIKEWDSAEAIASFQATLNAYGLNGAG